MDRRILIRKLIFILIVYGILNTGVFIWLKPELFSDTYYLIYIIIYYLAGILDTLIRPINSEVKEEGGYIKFILLLFILAPFIMILAVSEQKLLYSRIEALSIFGLVFYFIAAFFTVIVRIQLGKQATGTLVVVEEHELITSGVYKLVRHPMYAGSLFGLFGFMLVTQGYITGIVTYILYFTIMRDRAIYEEKLMLDTFGDQYREYMNKVKRFIPFVY